METPEIIQNEPRKKGIFRKILGTLLWIVGIFVVLVLTLQVVFTSSMLTNIVNRYADEYVDGDVNFGEVDVNMFRRFPNISLRIDDVSVTYPADRFDHLEAAGAQGELLYQGTGEIADTLVSFERFSASVNLMALLSGKINIMHVRFTKPRVFAHSYDDENSNWNMFRFATTEEEEDTTGMSLLPRMTIGRISLAGKPHVVYTDSQDTLFAMVDIGRAAFDGRLSTRQTARREIGLTLDSIMVAGRLASDTLAFRLQQMYIHEHEDHMDVGVAANAMFMTRNYGRLNLPLTVEGTVGLPKDSITTVQVTNMLATLAGVPIELDANIGFGTDKTYIEAMAEIPQWEVSLVLQEYVSHFIPEVQMFKTDATVSLLAACFGYYDHRTGKLPSFSAALSVPESYLKYEGLDTDMKFTLEANLANDEEDRIMVDLTKATVMADGLEASVSGSTPDILNEDPFFKVNADIAATLDSLVRFFPEDLGIHATGDLTAKVEGSTKLSQLDVYNFSYSDLSGTVHGNNIVFSSPKDTINAYIDGIDISLGPEVMTSRVDTTQSFRMLALAAKVDTTDISYKESMSLRGRSLALSAKNSADAMSRTDSTRLGRLGGTFTAKNIIFRDAADMRVRVVETSNRFQMMPKRDNPEVPTISVSSSNRRISLSTSENRALLSDAEIKADAAINSVILKKQREARLDSLARVYPDTPRDSLMARARAERGTRTTVVEDDFRDQDIDIRLDETMAKYFREWDLSGSISMSSGMVMTPYFPLRNRVQGLSASFNNDAIIIDSLRLTTGSSEIAGSGSVKGLKRALGGRGGSRTGSRARAAAPLDIDIALTSPGVDANELLAALSTGSAFNPDSLSAGSADMSDDEFLEEVLSDTAAVASSGSALLVIPSNINADVTLDASSIKYSDILIDNASARLSAKDRCVQIIDTKASTSFGNVSLDGFYATHSKKDIKAGFDFRFMDITAEEVIDLVPAMDTLIPMLKSFKGKLNCELAATAQLDTAMNILTPSINGVMRISGKDMTISDDKDFEKLANLLKFKDTHTGKVDAMIVEGVIKDNSLEVFPFVIQMDRYTMALSGVQNLDMSFKYHVSMIKSPLLFRFGVDFYGQDFDNLKFKLGKAKYKNANVPAFSAEIDKTRLNLSSSIRNIFEKGVENAIAEHQNQDAITEHKKAIGYVEAVDMEMEELSDVQKSVIKGE